jgi:hypothetical protein
MTTKKEPKFAAGIGPQRYLNTDPWPLAQWEEQEPLPTVGEVVTYLAGAGLLAAFCFVVLGLA